MKGVGVGGVVWWFGVFVLCVVSFDCFVCSLVILFHQEATVCTRMLDAWVRLVDLVGAGWGCLLCVLVVCCGQVVKGAWWMPWHREPMKDVGACEMPWGVGNRALIRGCPNGETQHELCRVTCT